MSHASCIRCATPVTPKIVVTRDATYASAAAATVALGVSRQYTAQLLSSPRINQFRMTYATQIMPVCSPCRDDIAARVARKADCDVAVLPGELWADVPGFEHLRASSLGRIISTITGYERLLKNGGAPGDYPRAGGTGQYVHRLVALAFLDTTSVGEVDHRDGDKTNAALSNLRWMSHRDNVAAARAMRTWARGEVRATCVTTGEERTFASAAAAARALGLPGQAVHRSLAGITGPRAGYRFERAA